MTSKAETVAWRYRYHDGGKWKLADGPGAPDIVHEQPLVLRSDYEAAIARAERAEAALRELVRIHKLVEDLESVADADYYDILAKIDTNEPAAWAAARVIVEKK